MKTFQIVRAGTGPFSAGIRPSPDYVDARVIVANTQEQYTVPNNVSVVLFSATDNFYAKPNASCAVPAADVSDGTAPELNPAAWALPPDKAQTINFNAPSNVVITVCAYL